MTRAVVATAFGGPEVLSVIETPVSPAGPGEVLISVRAAGTNPIDYKLYSGAMGRDPARLPMRLGFEVAGVVTQVTGGVEGPAGPVRAGDEVVGYRVIVAGVYPLAEAADAHRALATGHAHGKIILVP
jgi:NADPH:quinone reductase